MFVPMRKGGGCIINAELKIWAFGSDTIGFKKSDQLYFKPCNGMTADVVVL